MRTEEEPPPGILVEVSIGWHADGHAPTVETQPLCADERAFSPAVIKHVAAALNRFPPQ